MFKSLFLIFLFLSFSSFADDSSNESKSSLNKTIFEHCGCESEDKESFLGV